MFSNAILLILTTLLIFAHPSQAKNCLAINSILNKEVLDSLVSTGEWNIFEPQPLQGPPANNPFIIELKMTFYNETPTRYALSGHNHVKTGLIQIQTRNNQSFLHFNTDKTSQIPDLTSLGYSIISHEDNRYFFGYNCSRLDDETNREYVFGGLKDPADESVWVETTRILKNIDLILLRHTAVPDGHSRNSYPETMIPQKKGNSAGNRQSFANYYWRILGIIAVFVF